MLETFPASTGGNFWLEERCSLLSSQQRLQKKTISSGSA